MRFCVSECTTYHHQNTPKKEDDLEQIEYHVFSTISILRHRKIRNTSDLSFWVFVEEIIDDVIFAQFFFDISTVRRTQVKVNVVDSFFENNSQTSRFVRFASSISRSYDQSCHFLTFWLLLRASRRALIFSKCISLSILAINLSLRQILGSKALIWGLVQ